MNIACYDSYKMDQAPNPPLINIIWDQYFMPSKAATNKLFQESDIITS